MQQPQPDGNAVATKLAHRIAALELQLAIAEAKLESAEQIIAELRRTDAGESVQ